MGEKIRTTINIDKDLWDLLELKLPCSISAFFERQARIYLFSGNKFRRVRKRAK